MENDFKGLQKFVDEMKDTSSSNTKKQILKGIEFNEFIKNVLYYVNDPYITFGVTSDNVDKYMNNNEKCTAGVKYESIFDLLYDLNSRKLTGHNALDQIAGFILNNIDYEDLILSIIDRDLETRANSSLINKVFPGFIQEFKVALANPYKEELVDFEKEDWYCSRKLDGVRCICKVDNDGNSKFYSRTGKEFKTLDVLGYLIKEKGIFKNVILDGEICITDKSGKEDFHAIMKEIKKKNHSIKHPKFFIFDTLTQSEFNSKRSDMTFSERLKRLPDLSTYPNFEVLEQSYMYSNTNLELHKSYAAKEGWEGVMLRKDTSYKGKRSNDLLKVKAFKEAEYIVTGVINDSMRFFENGKDVNRLTLAAVTIIHEGNTVKVGSGFSKEEREHYFSTPRDIIGKWIKVRYFEETKNDDGTVSLRFPTFVYNYGDSRDE